MRETHDTVFKDVNPVIPVRDMRETLAFYEEKLGFVLVFDGSVQPGAAINYAGVHRAGVTLHLQTMAEGENHTMPLIRNRVENIEPL
jgi:catechol 2,3-dioxygenase-like lactoylglutathione lyase family enzyme